MMYKARGRLSPRLKPRDLETICLDWEQWDRLPEVADHPSAWPALQDWIDHAIEVGPDNAGEPPEPPEGWKRGDNKRPPKYQETEKPQNDETGDDDGETGQPDTPDPSERADDVVQTADEPTVPDEDTDESAKADDMAVEVPRRTLSGWTRSMLIPALIVGLVLVLGGSAYAVHAIGVAREQSMAAVQRSEREARERDELQRAVRKAETLAARIDGSPVSSDKAVKTELEALNRALRDPDTARSVATATKQAQDTWDRTMDEKAVETSKTLKTLIGRADGLKSAPDSHDRNAMAELADTWRGRKVTAANLTDAISAADRLDKLATTVEKAKKDADDRKKQEEEEPEKARTQQERQETAQQPAPQATVTTPQYHAPAQTTTPAPSRPATPSPAPSAPSWNVSPDPSSGGGTSMPGSDGSL